MIEGEQLAHECRIDRDKDGGSCHGDLQEREIHDNLK